MSAPQGPATKWFHTIVVVGAALTGPTGCSSTSAVKDGSVTVDGAGDSADGSAREAAPADGGSDGAAQPSDGSSEAPSDTIVDTSFPHITVPVAP